ncbi:MAG: hypothetical protein LWX56_00830 [Ignavibacteria bacterium]|nr:hypothetical protein [Ignavibacteria bacterium]
MKELRKQLLVVVSLSVFVFLLLYLAMKLKIDSLQADRVRKEDRIVALQNKKLSLIATEQSLQNESRVTGIAETELNLVRCTEIQYHLDVSSDDVGKIHNLIIQKNEH